MKIGKNMFVTLELITLEEEEEEKKHEELDEEKHEEWILERVEDIEIIIGYEFHDPILLQQSLTHNSVSGPTGDEGHRYGCPSLDRLAFIGDSFLHFMFTKEHYSLYPDLDPGTMTRLRSANVDTEKLARATLKHNLHNFLHHKIFQFGTQIEDFSNAIKEYPSHSSGLIDAPKVLADMMESLIGAIYLDSKQSMDITWKVAKNLLEPVITPENLPIHPVTQLQEMCSKKRLTVTMNDSWRETGEIEFVIDGQFSGRAKYGAKRVVAKNRAALNVYNDIVAKLDAAAYDDHVNRHTY